MGVEGRTGCRRSKPDVLLKTACSEGSMINLLAAKKGRPKMISVHRFRAIIVQTVWEDH